MKKNISVDTDTNSDSSSVKKYPITKKVLDTGYSALIDDERFVVVPNKYGRTFNDKNEEVFGVVVKGGVLINGENSGKDYFENLTPKQAVILATAGVITLDDKGLVREFYSKGVK